MELFLCRLSRNKHLAMVWIDYRKPYEMVPHLWIIECLDLFGVDSLVQRVCVFSEDIGMKFGRESVLC